MILNKNNIYFQVAAYGGEDAMRKRKRAKKDPHAPKRAL